MKTPIAQKTVYTSQQYLAEIGKHRGYRSSKYGNRWVTVDGIKFQSQKEADRWGVLNMMLRAKQIFNLRRQVRFDLDVPQGKICAYVADFVYEQQQTTAVATTMHTVVEDVKSEHTRKLRPYIMKRRMMKLILGITIQEV